MLAVPASAAEFLAWMCELLPVSCGPLARAEVLLSKKCFRWAAPAGTRPPEGSTAQ